MHKSPAPLCFVLISVCSFRARAKLLRQDLDLQDVELEQRFVSKEDLVNILVALCERFPEKACIPNVLQRKSAVVRTDVIPSVVSEVAAAAPGDAHVTRHSGKVATKKASH